MKSFIPKSKRISTIQYDEDNLRLTIEFVRGGTYEYYEVNSETYWLLVSAESVGKAFDQHVKNAGFEYRKL